MTYEPEPIGQTLARSDAQGESMRPPSQDEMIQQLAGSYYILKDELIQDLICGNPERGIPPDEDLQCLIPTVSHLLRTGNLDDRDIALARLHARIALRCQLLLKKSPKMVNVAKYYSWLNFVDSAILDTKSGWRGKLATERIRTYKIESNQQKRGFLGRLFGG